MASPTALKPGDAPGRSFSWGPAFGDRTSVQEGLDEAGAGGKEKVMVMSSWYRLILSDGKLRDHEADVFERDEQGNVLRILKQGCTHALYALDGVVDYWRIEVDEVHSHPCRMGWSQK
jgi:hypothetical protein